MANDMISFFQALLSSVSSWLMEPPILYFTGIFLGLGVIGLVVKLFHIK